MECIQIGTMWPDDPKFRKLRMAHAVATEGRFSAAAAMLGVTQPAITRAIATLEADLGFALFDRSTAHVAITENGHVVLDRVGRALRYLQHGPGTGDHLDLPALLNASDHELKSLVATFEHRSVDRAAQTLGVSQPAVSRSLLTLERRIGQPLYERSNTGLMLLPGTAGLVRRVRLAISELRQARDEVANLTGARSGRLTVGALPLARAGLVPEAMLRTLTAFPDADFTIQDAPFDILLQHLLEGDVDLIVGSIRDEPETADRATITLFEDTMAVVAASGHRLVGGGSVELRQTIGYRWVLPFPNVPLRRQFEDALITAGLELAHHPIMTDSTETLRSLVMDSDFIALTSRHQVEHDVARGLLAFLPVRMPATRRAIGVTTRRDYKATRLYSRFLDDLSDQARRYGID